MVKTKFRIVLITYQELQFFIVKQLHVYKNTKFSIKLHIQIYKKLILELGSGGAHL